MPSIGHLAVGLAAGRFARAPGRLQQAVWLLALVAASFAPDLDVLAFRLGIPYGAPFGHRGALHSIALGLVLGVLVGAAGRWLGLRWVTAIAAATLVAVSHGVLDAFTDGGKGIALFWPVSHARVFAPWRPIPVAPIGLAAFSPRGLAVMLRELVLFLPLFLLALWPTRRQAREEQKRREGQRSEGSESSGKREANDVGGWPGMRPPGCDRAGERYIRPASRRSIIRRMRKGESGLAM